MPNAFCAIGIRNTFFEVSRTRLGDDCLCGIRLEVRVVMAIGLDQHLDGHAEEE